MCVVTNSLGICSAGISEQDITKLCEIIHERASERTGTWLCLPSQHRQPSQPQNPSCGPGREQVVAAVAKEVSPISAPADPIAGTARQPTAQWTPWVSCRICCPVSSPFASAPLPPTYLEIYVLEIHRCENRCKNVRSRHRQQGPGPRTKIPTDR